MRKVIKISVQEPYLLKCVFDNGEVRLLDLENVLDKNQPFAHKVFEDERYKTAEIGVFGEIYWKNIAQIRTLDGKFEPCEYDISPELAYLKSVPYFNSTSVAP